MPKRSSKETPDLDQLVKSIEERATSDIPPNAPEQETVEESGKNPAAVALGRLGGKKGGPARAKSLTKKRRIEIAKKAAAARWKR